MNPTTATVLKDGVTALLENPYYCEGLSSLSCLDLPDCPMCRGCSNKLAFDASNKPIALTEPCEPCSRISLDMDAPVTQWADEDADYFCGWVNKPIENARTRIAYTPIKETQLTGVFTGRIAVKEPVSKETLPTESHIAELPSELLIPGTAQQGQTVEEAAECYVKSVENTQSYENDFASFIAGHNDCNTQWVKAIEERIKQLKWDNLNEDGELGCNIRIDELSSLLKLKGE